MDIQRHSSVLGDTVEKLSDEASYKQLFHAYRDEEALPSGEVLKEIIDLCRAILFPGYYGNARISKQTIRFHTGVNVETLHSLLSKQVYAGLCFADTSCVTCPEEKISAEAEAAGYGCGGDFQWRSRRSKSRRGHILLSRFPGDR